MWGDIMNQGTVYGSTAGFCHPGKERLHGTADCTEQQKVFQTHDWQQQQREQQHPGEQMVQQRLPYHHHDQLMRQLEMERNQLLGQLEGLSARHRCVVCLDATICVVFMPCAHLVCCTSCAPTLSTCPICRADIRYFVSAIID